MKSEMRDLQSLPTGAPALYDWAGLSVFAHLEYDSALLGGWQTLSGGRRKPLLPALDCPAHEQDLRLSFNNLIEAHVLRALRTRHKVPMSAVRRLSIMPRASSASRGFC